ncbi:hypothetical protein ACM61V_06045 [Sphingomonas sp. TX0543]|uniref:hypothetical protein n=1 Tax=unclassified Sphingomonas TaxID=196159 RepID=UPI0010F9D38B|nr:hypothetical protein [Sphingomonas sp. 3P27F8]
MTDGCIVKDRTSDLDGRSAVNDDDFFDPTKKVTAKDLHLLTVRAARDAVAAGEVKLRRNSRGQLDIGWSAKLLGIPRFAGYLPGIREEIEALATIDTAVWIEQPKLVRSADAFARPTATDDQLEALRQSVAGYDIVIRQEEIDAALDELVMWDADLALDGGKVPWRGGQPAIKPCAEVLKCREPVIRHEAVNQGIVELARRHGVVTICPSRTILNPKHSVALRRRIVDVGIWLGLRKERFPVLSSGHVDYREVTFMIGCDKSDIYRPFFRSAVNEQQLALCKAAGLDVPNSNNLIEAEYGAVLDLVELAIAAEDHVPIVESDRISSARKCEQRLGFVAGARNRFPTIGARINDIRARLEERRADEIAGEAMARRVAFVCRSIESLIPKFLHEKRRVAVDANGSVSMCALELSLRQKFPALWKHTMVVASVGKLVDEVGKEDPADLSTVRPFDMDHTIKILCRSIRARGFGFPWQYEGLEDFRRKLAIEIKQPAIDIEDRHLADVEAAWESMRTLGLASAPRPVRTRRGYRPSHSTGGDTAVPDQFRRVGWDQRRRRL